ncbi:uncharacterized protein N7469_002016 [Penicillium citrinum]|uniref:Uncharacterized protein n=1 Tax=Penicillium citrinum TaxID=5077 RepID=A0A9W9P9P5_PENCI|nr:uncharacterized protein N7469_002016 [Penicillium citrinum]KAJ5240425.1 hypothetical protein N7469_002016 [Penicillium citrinum]
MKLQHSHTKYEGIVIYAFPQQSVHFGVPLTQNDGSPSNVWPSNNITPTTLDPVKMAVATATYLPKANIMYGLDLLSTSFSDRSFSADTKSRVPDGGMYHPSQGFNS